jgi:arylsulfatase
MGPKKEGRGVNYPPTPLLKNTIVIESGTDQTQLTRKYTEDVIEFINNQSDKPFFLYFAHTFPHVSLYTNERFEGTSKRGLYGDVVEEIDWSVGEVMKALYAKGLDENTLVIFSSDNGPWLTQGENGGTAGSLRDGKGTWWEGGFRVPAIFRMPGKIKPCVSTQLIATMDIFPTFLGMTGIELPQNVTLDEVNQSGLLFEEKASSRDEVFYWWMGELMAVRKGPWKIYFSTIYDMYLRTRHIEMPDIPELYNLETDISERFNKSGEYPDIVKQLTEVAENHKKIWS